MHRSVLACWLSLVCLIVSAPVLAEDAPKKDRATLEKEFAELLSKSILVGRFTTDGKEGVPSEDRYEIGKAAKVQGEEDMWIFAGIKYGKKEINIPLVIRVAWADDTPTMTMDKMTIPGLGTFSFRILFHGTRYAGTWQHDDHGGHMWGRVEKQAAKEKPVGKNEAALREKLKQTMAINFKEFELFQGLSFIFQQLKIPYGILEEDLILVGVDKNTQVTVRLDQNSAADVLDQILSAAKLCAVVSEEDGVVRITTEAAAKRRGWRPLVLVKPEGSIAERLRHKFPELVFENETLQACFEELGRRTDITFELLVDDLKAKGVTRNMKQSLTLNDASAATAAEKMLSPIGLCLVVDDAKGVVFVTSEPAAKARKWQIFSAD